MFHILNIIKYMKTEDAQVYEMDPLMVKIF